MEEKSVVVLCDDMYEVLELWYPYYRLQEEGFKVVLAGDKIKEYKSKHGYPVTPSVEIEDLQADSVQGIIIPGGFAPDRLRRYPTLLHLIQQVYEGGGLIASICHGPWVMISAGILQGRQATCFHAIKDDLVNAGAHFKDEAVVVDNNLITSRTPADLPFFLFAIISFLKANE